MFTLVVGTVLASYVPIPITKVDFWNSKWIWSAPLSIEFIALGIIALCIVVLLSRNKLVSLSFALALLGTLLFIYISPYWTTLRMGDPCLSSALLVYGLPEIPLKIAHREVAPGRLFSYAACSSSCSGDQSRFSAVANSILCFSCCG